METVKQGGREGMSRVRGGDTWVRETRKSHMWNVMPKPMPSRTCQSLHLSVQPAPSYTSFYCTCLSFHPPNHSSICASIHLSFHPGIHSLTFSFTCSFICPPFIQSTNQLTISATCLLQFMCCLFSLSLWCFIVVTENITVFVQYLFTHPLV